MALANLTAYDNLTSPLQVATATNDATGGYLFGLVLLLIFVVFFIVFKNFDTKAVMVGDSFITTLIAALMWGANLIGFKIFIWPLLALFGSLIALLFWPD